MRQPFGQPGHDYEIQRRIGTGSFQYIEISGERSFEDSIIPAGSQGIVYQITAVRGKTRGAPAQFLVNFGAQGMTATALSGDAGGEFRLAS